MSKAEDELAVRRLAEAYTDAVNRRDGAGMAAVYAEDGVLELGGARPIVGLARLEKGFRRLVEQDREFLFQMNHCGVVEVDGDRAMGRWWFSEVKKPTGQPYEMAMGVYQDEAIRTPAGWRFARRRVNGLFRRVLPESELGHGESAAFLPITGLPTAETAMTGR